MPLSRVTCAMATVGNNGNDCAVFRTPDLRINMINLMVSPRQMDRGKQQNLEEGGCVGDSLICLKANLYKQMEDRYATDSS